MTPWQFRVCANAAIEKEKDDTKFYKWCVWHMAVLSRMDGKKMPTCGAFMGGTPNKNTVPAIDENAIMTQLKAYQAKKEELDRQKGKK